MKVITGNLTKNDIEYLKKHFPITQKVYKEDFDEIVFKRWYDFHTKHNQISCDVNDIYYMEKLVEYDKTSKIIIIGEKPETEDGELIETSKNYLFLEKIDIQLMKDFLNG